MNPAELNLNYLTAFLGGVLLSFTPCIYPLIPVIVGSVVSLSGGRRFYAFILSFLYVTGLSLGYSLMGLVASLTGKVFGFLSFYPLTYILAGMIIIFFGLWMLEIINLNFSLKLKFVSQKNKGFGSSFLLGLFSSFLISPCLTPVLGSIMAYLATKQNLFYGMSLLFIFGYGLGFILLLSGTFSSILLYLPKSGKWLVYVKKFSGMVVLISGIYFLWLGLERLK